MGQGIAQGRPGRALEVVVCFDGEMVLVRHESGDRPVRIGGGPGADLPAAVEALGVPELTFALGADGVLLVDQRRCPGDQGFRLERGPLVIWARAIDHAAPRVGVRVAIDWAAQRFTGASLVAHVLLLVMILSVPPDAAALSFDTVSERRREVIIRVIAQVDRDVARRVLDATRRAADAAPAEGARGGRAAGAEGAAGDRRIDPRRRGRLQVRGAARDLESAAGPGGQTGTDLGVVSVLGHSRAFAMLTDPAAEVVGSDARTALGSLYAANDGPGFGQFGTGLTGTGPGGGCRGAGCRALLGTDDGWRNRIGTGARGDGPGGPRGHGPALPMRKREATIEVAPTTDVHAAGGIDKEIVRRVIRAHINEIRYCYERALVGSADLEGRVVTEFSIAANGRVAAAAVAQSSLGDHEVEGCIVDALRRWEFPAPTTPVVTRVRYPFVLTAAAR